MVFASDISKEENRKARQGKRCTEIPVMRRIMARSRIGCKCGIFERHFFSSILPRLLTRKPQVLMQSHTELWEGIAEVEYKFMKGF